MSASNSSSSYTYTSSTSSIGGQASGTAYSQQAQSGPDGTRIQTTSQNLGEPAVQEFRQYDAQGREQPIDPKVLPADGSGGVGRIGTAPVELESEEDRLYKERMEDEYAKREGGA